MSQIVGYVTTNEAKAFARYAESLGVDVSALANLLLRREMHLGRLDEIPAPPTEERTVKITAHLKGEALKTSFTEHASKYGLRAGPAATRLFRAELEERWLEACLRTNHVDSV